MQLAWSLVRAALQPVRLRDLRTKLDKYVNAIRRSNGPRYQRQREQLGLIHYARPP